MPEHKFTLNGRAVAANADGDSPLLYVLLNELHTLGPRFGCGLAQCGSCSVLMDGIEIRSCVMPVTAVQGREVTTLEGLPAWYAQKRKLPEVPELHPLQQAMIDEQAVQCGYCTSGLIIKGAELLEMEAAPDDARIRQHMAGHLCRCGTYPRVTKAILRAAAAMRGADRNG